MLTLKIDINLLQTFALVILAFIALIYIFFDVNYYVISAFIVLWGKIHKKRKKLNESTEFYSICTTNDLDVYFSHMNNARYMRDLDFARMHFYVSTGLEQKLSAANGCALQTASNIRYRRPIPLFTFYKVITRLIHWDDKNIYLEHQFVTLNDGFIRTVVLSKQFITEIDLPETIATLMNNEEFVPTQPPEFENWMSLLEKSSATLRKKES